MPKKVVKDVFFKDIKGTLVFDKQAFNFAINNRQLLPDSYTRFKFFDKKVLSNAVRVNKDGEKKITDFSKNDNLLIKGNNLFAMYSLLPIYKVQIKLY